MSARIKIKTFGKIVDVFHGEMGWAEKNWTRFIRVNGQLKYVKGATMTPHDFNVVLAALEG